jgi:diguanylate cyclase (GGDEF)-like protein/PAS domain S-box-containing protein
VKPVHKLFSRQFLEARSATGEIDLGRLGDLVSAAYEQSERDRRQTERSMALMVEELDQLNRELERLVEERTSELREREAQLKIQNMRFDATINHMPQAVLMFDASGRLMVCNHHYNDMYGLPAQFVQPGKTIRELLNRRKQNGTYPGDPDDYIEKLTTDIAQGKSVSQLVELPDGRAISVLNHPMPGGGWVSTHEDITERRQAERQIAHMARHDALTNLPNRLLLRERLAQALADVPRGEQLAVLYLGLDNFRSVNDTLGRRAGDELLRILADRLQGCIREPDTVARVGGDEFAIIQTRLGQPADAAVLARRVCEAIRAPFQLMGHLMTIDTSIGIAIAPGDGTQPGELLKNSDMALCGAKADGRGIYRFFEPAMDARMKARRGLETALRHALAQGEFELYYQPVVGLRDHRVSCCEALLRWRHPERGVVSPVEFIPVAEEIGLIVPLGEWVLRTACAQAALWPDDIKVAVNLSPIQVMNENLVATVVGALAAAGLPAQRLELEITESVLMQNTQTTLATLHRLRELGVKISMDDFGTGYSSLSYLRSFPFDKIKIDRCFISGLADGDDSVAIVLAIAGLAKNLGITTTAEGVETKQQMQQVKALGCTEMQGFLFSPPRRVEELAPMFRLRSARKATAAPSAAQGSNRKAARAR